jgi:hypothetical protein
MRKDRSWVLADADELARHREEDRPRGRIRLLLAASVKGGIVAPLLACNPKGGYDPTTESLTFDPSTEGNTDDATSTTTTSSSSDTTTTTTATTGTTGSGTTQSETTGTGTDTDTDTDTEATMGTGTGTDTDTDTDATTGGTDDGALPSPRDGAAALEPPKKDATIGARTAETPTTMRSHSARVGDDPTSR